MRVYLYIVTDKCVTEEASDRVAELCLSFVAALKIRLRKTHPHRPNMLGQLLMFLADIRELNLLFEYHNYKRLTEFKEVINRVSPLVKEAWSPENRAYGLISDEFAKHLHDLPPNSKKNKSKKPSTPDVQRESLNVDNFQFFVPPRSFDVPFDVATRDSSSDCEQPLNLSTENATFL